MDFSLKRGWMACLLISAGMFLNGANLYSQAPENRFTISIELLPDGNCDLTLAQVKAGWPVEAMQLTDSVFSDCVWSKISISNPASEPLVQFLYFPISWWSLEYYRDNSEIPQRTGIREESQFVRLALEPGEETVLFIRYPAPESAQLPTYRVEQLSASEVAAIAPRTSIKFFLLGFLLFPFFFFLAQYLIERDRLNFAYLVFLLGSGLNLLTILESTPYFVYTPKLVLATFSFQLIQKMFIVSVYLSLGGLVKYIHYLLRIKTWNPGLHNFGNWLLWAYLLVMLVPFVVPRLFSIYRYDSYLPYLRIGALLLILYILMVCVWAFIRKIAFSRILVLAFAPFVGSSFYYALSFVFRGSYTSDNHESIILILGFFLTLLLFGLILSVRNKLVKSEKVRLEQKTEQLKELDHFKSRFYTNFTHEFRTPLTVISGVAAQIEGHEQEKAMIRRNSKRLLNTVNQLLELSRLESKSLSVDMVHSDIINFLQYLTESCASLANQKKINLAFFSPHESLVMDYDVMMLQQILINLLSNAIKFTPEYGTVKVVATEIPESQEKMLRLTVTDTGNGIPAEHLPHIFDRFYQADSSDTRSGEGSGIGLALVRELVHLLDGRIEVFSDPDRGTRFEVYLPVRHDGKIPTAMPEIDDALPEVPDGTVEGDAETDGDKPLVLLIEDNADVTEYIVNCLRDEFSVSAARNGKAGVEKAAELVPDVIISDVMMPEMDGFEVCATVKSDRRTSHIPVMLLTAKATREDRVSGFKQGADAYLTKPFDKEELMIRLANLVAISQRLRENLTSDDQQVRKSDALSKQESAFLEEVDALIRTNMEDQEFDTRMLCREVAMSRTQLHRKLKALTGESTASYIRVRRLRRARQLLEETDLPVGDITVRVGFKDFSHFSRSYSIEFGKTPTEARNG